MLPALAAGVGMAAKIGGDLMQRNDAAASDAAQAAARNQVLLKYLKQQRGLEMEGRGYLDNTMAGYAPGAQDTLLADKQQGRTDAAVGAIGPMSDPNAVTVSGSAPQAVRGEIAKRMLTAFTGARDRARAMGALSGYGDQWFDNNADVADTARRVGTLNNFSRGNSAILSSQQDLAQMGAKQPGSMWGPILSAGGSALMSAGMGSGLRGSAAPVASGPDLGGGVWAGL